MVCTELLVAVRGLTDFTRESELKHLRIYIVKNLLPGICRNKIAIGGKKLLARKDFL